MKKAMIAVVAFALGAAIGIVVFIVLERGAEAAPSGETSAERSAAKKNLIKDVSFSAREKPARASSEKEAEPKPERTEGARAAAVEDVVDAPKSDGVDAEKKDGRDNPFPRYLDMFRNNPAALVAEFEKEAEADRAKQRKMRDWTIDKLKLNTEQSALFEEALNDLRDEITQQNREWAELVMSGQLNDETAADGSIWSSNPLLGQRKIAARETAVRETAEMLYERLVLDGVSDAEEQRLLFNAVYQTSFSYECSEPNLAIYDKVYKNMGFGNGIFSWNVRQRQLKKK